MKLLIKKETISKIEEEIRNKTTIPNNLKEKIKKDVFTNILISIGIIIYFTFLIAGSTETTKNVREIDFNIFSILLLGVSIYLFEIAYKKDNVSLAIYGIETLVVAITTLFFPYIIFELDEFHKKYYMIVSVYIAVYYIIKSIYIVSKIKKMHVKQSSDIKEIVKKEKRKLNIKEEVENIKTPKEERKEKNKEQTQETKNIQDRLVIPRTEKIITQKQENAPKKRGRPKKTVEVDVNSDSQRKQTKKSETIKTENKNNVGVDDIDNPKPKKRGRPKKTETINKENKPEEMSIPKKRGRPRKAVIADD